MITYIRRISDWGVNSDTPHDQAHHIRLTNVLLLFMFFGSIAETLLCYFTGAIEAALLNSTAPLVFGGGLLLMKSGRTVLARVLVVTISNVAAYALVTSLGADSYFQFIFLFSSAFSLAFFSIEERVLLAYGMALPLVLFIVLELTHYQPLFGMPTADLDSNQLLMMRTISLTLIWSLMVFHFFYFIRDRRKSQEQLVSSAKMVAMGRMAAGIAHEVNNPLQLIVTLADRLKLLSKSTGESQEMINGLADQIQNVALRIGSINKGLLALSRDVAGDPMVEVPVHKIIKLSLDFCRAHLESHRVELRVSDIPKHWTVIGRETQLSEVLLNILDNAYYAALDSAQKWIRIDATAEKDWIEISITDSGAGVKPSVLHRIFDPFFTTKPFGKGTGLGLSVSQGIMTDHGGQIFCDSQNSSGAKFVVRIPRAPNICEQKSL